MAEGNRPEAREPVGHDEQWRAARASRRETLSEIVVIEQTWSRWRTAILAGVGILVGSMLGVGGLSTASATTPAPPTAIPVVIVLEITATPPPTLLPSPTPSPSPTITSTPTVPLSPPPTATRPPTATPSTTPPAPVAMAVIEARALNVRAGPGIDYAIIGYAARDQCYRIIDRSEDGGWLRLDFDGLVGWVSAGWVQIDGRAKELPARGELR